MVRHAKKVFLLFSIIFLLTSNVSYAHTYLHDSNPADGEVVAENLTEVVLYFETRIEPLSTFKLVLNDETEIDLDVTVEDDTLVGKPVEPLANGEYTVDWNIIGEDGHPITGDFSFTVAAEENQEAPAEEQGTEDTDNAVEEENEQESAVDPNEQGDADLDAQEPENGGDQAEAKNSPVGFIFIALLVLLVVLLLLTLRKKRK